ncbi:uncharacterized protein N7477_003776 [Penicillium maclennaniae]|uniref:uncharacterized protein n=1 Tax=Penicillium maclennaniae TaxID=1343394 RepID=UPI002541CB85|nr:uncharacterized protein N7477_003776 [Penicillium maclennaniae]KAJ5678143.1 hypothetical protein N7477_003776 [Penicillium maclennaniae]
MQEGSADDMIFNIFEIVSYLSQWRYVFQESEEEASPEQESLSTGQPEAKTPTQCEDQVDHVQDHWDETKSTLCNHLPSFDASVNILSKDQDYVKWSNSNEQPSNTAPSPSKYRNPIYSSAILLRLCVHIMVIVLFTIDPAQSYSQSSLESKCGYITPWLRSLICKRMRRSWKMRFCSLVVHHSVGPSIQAIRTRLLRIFITLAEVYRCAALLQQIYRVFLNILVERLRLNERPRVELPALFVLLFLIADEN